MNLKVSIIIPVYNGSNYLNEAIDSALAQTYKNIEIIVVNDGLNDDGETEKVAKSYSNRIKYYKKENGGVATALNLGIKKMTGEYFSWLSHDDKYKSKKIEKQIKFLRTVKDKNVILFSNYALMDEHGKLTGKCEFNHEMLENIPIYSLLRGNVNGITMLIPKAAFEDYGEFDVSLRSTQDYDMWYKMIKTYKFLHLKETLATTRIHSMQDTQASPATISESNTLWIKMVSNLADSEKVKAEGSLLKFYLEMIKFLRQTPYTGALEYCEHQLENIAQTREAGLDGSNNKQLAIETHESLINEGQNKAAAYYLENVIKQMVNNGDAKSAAYILSEKLVGKDIGITENNIKNNYVSKIGNKSQKIRLMFCSGHWLTGGMERVLSNLFKQLSDEYELFLLTPFDGHEGQIELPDYVTHIKISNQYFYDSFDHIALSYALMFDIDIAVGFMNLSNGQLDFYELCVGTRIKTIASNNEMYFYPYHNPYYYSLIQHRINIFKNVDVVLWLTNFSAAAYGLAHNNSFLIPNPNTYKVQEGINKNGKDKIILCVGRYNDHVKRIDRILNCFSIVSKRQPDAKLMLVGKCNRHGTFRPDDETTIDDLLKKFNINEEKVMFIGEVGDVDKYYAQASVLLLASTSEGFGMVINEAACFGVPSVCNKIPGLEDLVVDGKNGFLTDQDDIESLADCVAKILSDSKLREELGANAKKMVTRFDEVGIGKKWKYLIKTLLENNSESLMHSKLNMRLSYKTQDNKKFSELLFDEINNVVTASLDERNNLLNSKFESIASFILKRAKKNYRRLNKAIKTKGFMQTCGIIAKKLLRKVQRLYKRV